MMHGQFRPLANGSRRRSRQRSPGIARMLVFEGYLNLKGYGEFAAHNPSSGWNMWLTFSVSQPEPAAVHSRIPMLHK
jgi:hypothetical protein